MGVGTGAHCEAGLGRRLACVGWIRVVHWVDKGGAQDTGCCVLGGASRCPLFGSSGWLCLWVAVGPWGRLGAQGMVVARRPVTAVLPGELCVCCHCRRVLLLVCGCPCRAQRVRQTLEAILGFLWMPICCLPALLVFCLRGEAGCSTKCMHACVPLLSPQPVTPLCTLPLGGIMPSVAACCVLSTCRASRRCWRQPSHDSP